MTRVKLDSKARAARNKAIEEDSKAAIRTRCEQLGWPQPVDEHRFHPTRRWKFDMSWPAYKIALELEGGIYSGGRHVSGSGYVRDLEKYNQAVTMGWAVVRFTHGMIADDSFLSVLAALFSNVERAPT